MQRLGISACFDKISHTEFNALDDDTVTELIKYPIRVSSKIVCCSCYDTYHICTYITRCFDRCFDQNDVFDVPIPTLSQISRLSFDRYLQLYIALYFVVSLIFIRYLSVRE